MTAVCFRGLVLFSSFFLSFSYAVDSPSLNVPAVQTELKIPQANLINGKLTVGDVLELQIYPPPTNQNAIPEQIKEMEKGSINLGNGRLLWWKPFDKAKGYISVGITTYQPNWFDIPPIKFIQDGKPVFTSTPQRVQFFPVETKKEKEDIYQPIGVGFPVLMVALILLCGLLSAALALWLLWRWLSKRRKIQTELKSQTPPLTPLEELEKLIRSIQGKSDLQNGKFKPHYFGISDASKVFLGRVFHFDAEESTTRELIQKLSQTSLSPQVIQEWKELFEEMDLVKFTDHIPDAALARSLADRILTLARKAVVQ